MRPDLISPVPGLCHAGSSQLVVVDVQERLAAAMPAEDRARVLRNLGILLEAARLLDVPVLATEQYPRGLGPSEPEVASRLPAGAAVLEKTSFSCCGADGFAACLGATPRPQVVLGGMEAHVCVLQTAFELRDQGFQVFVVEDAVCSRAPDNHANALARLRQAGVLVPSTESVVFEWLGNARHPQFKAISALLK
ncbi:MAG: hydrolase [Gammaproteobacteria bacterium]|nr:hydrolase [Gammaproteobacteria bacterium]